MKEPRRLGAGPLLGGAEARVDPGGLADLLLHLHLRHQQAGAEANHIVPEARLPEEEALGLGGLHQRREAAFGRSAQNDIPCDLLQAPAAVAQHGRQNRHLQRVDHIADGLQFAGQPPQLQAAVQVTQAHQADGRAHGIHIVGGHQQIGALGQVLDAGLGDDAAQQGRPLRDEQGILPAGHVGGAHGQGGGAHGSAFPGNGQGKGKPDFSMFGEVLGGAA